MYLLLSAVTGRVRLHRLLLFIVNTCTYSYQLSLAVSDSIDCCCLRQHVYLLLSAVTGRVRLPRLLLFIVNTCTYSYQLSLAVSDSNTCTYSYQTVVVYRQHVYLLLSAVTGRVRLPPLLLFTSTRVPTPISCHWPCQTPSTVVVYVNTCTYSYQLSLAVSDSLHCCCLSSTRVPTPISCHWPCQTP